LRFKKEVIDLWIEKKIRLPFELHGEKLYNKKTTAGSDERSCL